MEENEEYYKKGNVYVKVLAGISGRSDYAKVEGHNISEANLKSLGYERVSLDDDMISNLMPQLDGSFLVILPRAGIWATSRRTQQDSEEWACQAGYEVAQVSNYSTREKILEFAETCRMKEIKTVIVADINLIGTSPAHITRVISSFTGKGINIHFVRLNVDTMVDGRPNPTIDLLLHMMRQGVASVRKSERKRNIQNNRKAQTQAEKDAEYFTAHKSVIRYLNKGLSIREVALLAKVSKSTVLSVMKRIPSDANHNE